MEFTRCFQCMEEITGYPCPNCGYDPAKCPSQSFVLRPGTILRGKYVIGAVLGQGGFGITYIGWDLALERKVAVKEYYPMGQVSRNAANSNTLEWNTSEQARLAQGGGMDYFLKEGRKMARVADIPQVVNVLDIFQENETAYIIMNYSQGQTLKTYLKRNGPLGWAEAETIFLPVVNAMEQVHKAGLIHRDLSPDNLMLLPDGSVKILDLGAAKDLNINTGASSMQVAKHGFSPLEQYLQRGGSGPWSDVYALAATMYYSLAGVLPLPSVDRMAEDTLRWDLPQLTALPENVLTALQRAMAISPKARTQSMAEFASQLTAPVTVQPQQPEREVEPDRDKGTDAKAVENKKPEAAPESKKEPAPKEKEAPGDTVVSKERKHSDRSSGKARKRLPVIAAVLTLLVVAGGILIWYTKKAPAGPDASENTPAQIQETEGYSPTENNTDKTLDDASAEAYAAAEALAQNGESAKAAMAFYALGDYQDARERSFALWDTVAVRDTISVGGGGHTVAVKADGTVVAVGSDSGGECDVANWTDIVAISADDLHTVGLKADGTVVAVGHNNYGQCDVSSWTDIVSISAGGEFTVGLKADGTVVAVGREDFVGSNVSDWRDIIAISAGTAHIVGLKTDGSVVALGWNEFSQCNTGNWTGIVAISAGNVHTVGLKADGTMMAVGSNGYGQCDVFDWTDIIAVSAGTQYTVGLKADGTVVAVGDDAYSQCNVSGWRNVVAVSAGTYHTVGLKSDGTMLAVGDNNYGKCNVGNWKNIKLTGSTGTSIDTEKVAQPKKTLVWGGYDMTNAEFGQRFTQMIETANSWTRDTAPQTLDDFPLFPPSFLELLKTVESAEEEMTISDSILTWKSELSKILPGADTDMEYDRYFAYVDNNENAWVRIPFESIGTCEYSVQLPENVWEANNSIFELSIYGYNAFDEWQESLEVSYSISGKRIDGTDIVSLCMSNGQYSFNWFYYAQNSTIAVDIYSHSNGRVWWMTYDAASGKLVGLSK